MEVVVPNPEKKSTRTQAYTLAEVMVSVFILSVMMISLYAGFYSGFAIVKLSRKRFRSAGSWS